jgi:riboflavin synthase
MFTGIIEQIGTVVKNEKGGLAILVSLSFSRGVKIGSSIAVDGACLTVVKCQLSNVNCQLYFNVVPETLRRTNLGLLQKGDQVNLERAMKANGRFEGHIVQGHIDGIGRIKNYELRITNDGTEDRIFTIELNQECMRYIVSKGSIAVDGVSLTVVDALKNYFTAAVIPHTFENTIAHDYKKGARVNIEVDILAKYVDKLKT